MEKPELRKTAHNHGNSPITLNPDGIRKSVQHESGRGKNDLQLCRRKYSKKMSWSWGNKWNSDVLGGGRNPNAAEKRNPTWIRTPTLSTTPIRSKSSRFIQGCYLNKIALENCKNNRSKWGRKIKNTKNRELPKISGRFAAAGKNLDFANLW